MEYDFIWSSPPCPSHSRVRSITVGVRQIKAIYPDMKLYEEILFLQEYFKGLWVVENVIPFYEPLIRGYKVGNHLYWANFIIPNKDDGCREHNSPISILEKRKGFELSKFKTNHDKKKLLRNCVEPEMGLYVFKCAFKDKQKTLMEGL